MPDLAMLDYFYGDEAEQFTFYRIPKVLFTDPSYRRISSDAKILYGLMLDRMGLSVRNGWLDEYNRVFIFFTLEDALEYLCCGHTKAVSLFGELDKAGLIERKKQGQGKPTKIYVKNFVRNAEVLTSEKRKSKVPQSGSQDFQKTASNNTEIKDTELSDTEPSIHPARGLPEDKSPAADAMDTMRVYRQIIMENIEYDITRRQLGYDADILDEIVDIMVDTVCSTKPMIRIGGQDFPLEVVKSRLLKLNSEHTYKRVSTTMQIDGYSLDAQKSRIKAFADYNDYEIVREYEDAGKSGKSIEGRIQFNQMMDDIKSGKDGVSFVLVFKLSRFGRNAADVLSTLQVMQDFGVNLICVEDGIDSSKDAGKLMISVLSAVAEIERENIRVQTMEGRIQKAREGKWNGGFAPYGYQLIDGELQINEEEAAAIRVIYDQYVNTDIGSNGIAKYLENHGIRKIQRQNGKNPLFDAHLIRLILKNPVYCGKIAYGRRRTEKVHGTRNDYHLVEQDDYLLVDGLHEAIISEETWQAAQIKLLAQAKKYEHVNKGKDTRTHLLSGIVKCPICGAGMYGNKCIKHKKDGTKYKDFYYYGCKHRTMTRGHKCAYKKQIREELLDDAVAEVIVALVSKPKFASMMQEKINMKVDTSVLDQEIANHEKQLRQFYSIKSKLMEEIDSLDPDDRHYLKRKADLDDRLYRMYDKIEDEESQMIEARAKRQAIEAEKLTGDNIYKVLMYFDKLYSAMNDVERRRVMETLISEIQIYEDRQPNGQWLKSIKFKLPIIEEDMEISLDNDTHVECVIVLSKGEIDSKKVRVEFSLEGMDTSGLQKGVSHS